MTEPLRIVVVEDEAIVLMQIEMLLEDAGHTVVGTAMSADEAIAQINDKRPELALIDLNLKDGSSGFDVARAVRHLENMTIVFATANVLRLSEDLDGAAAVIAKPFNDRTLEGSIAYLEECVRRPPPQRDLPCGMRLAPGYSARLAAMRAAR